MLCAQQLAAIRMRPVVEPGRCPLYTTDCRLAARLHFSPVTGEDIEMTTMLAFYPSRLRLHACTPASTILLIESSSRWALSTSSLV
jgi:hypothetical protein